MIPELESWGSTSGFEGFSFHADNLLFAQGAHPFLGEVTANLFI